MGCDIHLHIELKDKDGVWHHYAAPSINRNYRLFEKMAGVRGDVEEAISSPKGAPENLSLITLTSHLSWSSDAHSTSWLDYDEIVKLSIWTRENLGDLEHDILRTYLFGESFMIPVKDLFGPFVDIRFVFWFDN